MQSRTSWILVGACAAAALLAVGVRGFRGAESTRALRGEAVAARMGCFACHGTDGRGGVADPGSRNGMVPGWDGPTVGTLVASDEELREWIMDGVPARLRPVESLARRAPLVPMPAYRGRLSEAEFGNLAVYFRAVSTFGAEMPEAVYEGWKVAGRLGCFGCHGPGGIGGKPNPGSLKGHIPAWDGDEFPELVRGDAELVEWIVSGHPRRLWENPAARHFLEGQAIGMPAYGPRLSQDDQARLVAYFQWIRKSGGRKASGEDTHKVIGFMGAPHAMP